MSIKKVFTSVGYRCLYITLYITSLLPATLLFMVANVSFLLIYHIFRYRRDVVLLNIARSFPNQRYDEISAIKRTFYRRFIMLFVDMVKAISVSPQMMDQKIEFSGLSLLDNALDSGKSVIACLGHCSNWEMLHFLSHKINHEVYAVYKPLSSDIMNRLMIKLRTRFGMKVITNKSVIRHIRTNDSPGAVYLFLADQCPNVNDEKFRYCFLNQDTYFFSGMEKLARKSNSVVVYLNVTQLSDGRYKVVCKPVSNCTNTEPEGEITRKYVRLLEENIKEQPGSWLWTHRRWKR